MRIVTEEEIETIEWLEAQPEERKLVGETTEPREPSTLLERAIALIPSGAIAVWVALTGFTPQSQPAIEWLTLAISWVVCVGLLWRTTKKPDPTTTRFGRRNRLVQIVVATAMFPIYVYTIGGPFDELGWYDPMYGTYALVAVYALTATFFPQIASFGLQTDSTTDITE